MATDKALVPVVRSTRSTTGSSRWTLDSMAPMPCAGAYARVVAPGRIGLGDTVRWV